MSELDRIQPQSEDDEFRFGTAQKPDDDPANYDADPNLTAAVKVALLLGMPLLLTGAPGCGKTSVARWLAWRLKLGEPLVHNVKSTSTGRDLLYEFDELGRFRDSQGGEKRPMQEYVRLNALGLAILYSNDPHKPLGTSPLTPSMLIEQSTTDAHASIRFRRRNVVLIDELDKAPRDTPNDLLLEVDQMRFRINELNVWVEGQADSRPIVVVTSNSEKSLPEPFLRRCVFHHIAAPNDERRRDIIARREHPFAKRYALFDDSMRFFDSLHGLLGRAPGTAELLAWLTVLEERTKRYERQNPEAVTPQPLIDLIAPTLGVLAKTKEDLQRAQKALGVSPLD